MPRSIDKPLWTCPKCGNRFVTRNLWHSCVRVPLSRHFEARDPVVSECFERFRKLTRQFGPFRIIPQKTRITFQTKVRFAGAVTRKRWLQCNMWLTERHDHPTLERVEQIYPNCWIHYFRIRRPDEMDVAFVKLLELSWQIGLRRHLRS